MKSASKRECRRRDHPQYASVVKFLHRRSGQPTQPLGLLLPRDKPGPQPQPAL
jgi:hypothetical protein